MGYSSGIEWTDATFNPWIGCEKVSPACAHCYAASYAERYASGEGLWDGNFRVTSDTYWRKPLAWNRQAEAARQQRFVFCASLADVFQDEPELVEPRERLWELIGETRWLVWLLLTKRPDNIPHLMPWDEAPENVWLGTSVENSHFTWRAHALTETRATVHFLSCEPLLGSLFDPRPYTRLVDIRPRPGYTRAQVPNRSPLSLNHIEWVIGGGESGPGFRPTDPAHVLELRDRCADADVPFFWKQWGGRTPKAGGKAIEGREWCERPNPAPPRALTLF